MTSRARARAKERERERFIRGVSGVRAECAGILNYSNGKRAGKKRERVVRMTYARELTRRKREREREREKARERGTKIAFDSRV